MRPATVVVTHTFGEGARFHPHLHTLVTSGGWDASRVWHPVPPWDQGVLRELFEIEVFRFLHRRDLLSRERMELIRSWPHSGFGVHVGGSIAPEDRASLARIARYVLRAPVVLARLAYDRDRATVRIDSRGSRADGGLALDVLDFIARLTIHIPQSHERLVHSYGLYSNASGQRKALRQGRAPRPDQTTVCAFGEDDEWRRGRRIRWAKLIRQVWQDDPLLCPRCGGTMRIISLLALRAKRIRGRRPLLISCLLAVQRPMISPVNRSAARCRRAGGDP